MPRKYAPALWEKLVSTCVSVLIFILVGWLVYRNEPFSDPDLVVLLRIILSVSAAIIGATIPGFLEFTWKGPGAYIRAGGALALFVITYTLTPSVVNQDPPPKPSASVSLLSGSLPEALGTHEESYRTGALQRGQTLIYRAQRQDGVLTVLPYLRLLEQQQRGAPVFPFDIQSYFFTVPTLSIIVNNPGTTPIAISSIDLVVEERSLIRDSWLYLRASVDRASANEAILYFQDYGLGEFHNAEIDFDIIAISSSQADLNAKDLVQATSSSWDSPFPMHSDANTYSNIPAEIRLALNDGSRVSFRLSSSAIKAVDDLGRYALIIGTLKYFDVAETVRNVDFAVKLYLGPPLSGGGGRVNPSYRYTVELPPIGPGEIYSISAPQEVRARGQDHFLLAIYTGVPSQIYFNTKVRLSDGTELEAGKVNLQSFYPLYYGLGGEPEYAGTSYILAEQ